MDRRTFLGRMLAAGAAGATTALLPPLARRALGQALAPVFPTIFIQLRGGWDPISHFSARTGFVNREVSEASIRQTAAGIRWHEPSLSSMAGHMEEAVVIRNVNMGRTDHLRGPTTLWFGNYDDPTGRPPWVNHLASALAERAQAPAPNVTAYWERDEDISRYVNFFNASPNPLAAAQRILSIRSFASSLDVSQGLPTAGRQRKVYDAIGRMDTRLYSPRVQPRILQSFTQANAQANDLLGQTITSVWPPAPETMDALGVTADDLGGTGYQNIPGFKAMCTLAYQLARYQLSNVISFTGDGNLDYDTHNNNGPRQPGIARRYFPPIARLLSALKATPSPVLPGVSMFDTTHVVIASEMGRSPNAEDGTGTFHWQWTHAVAFGGRFKRGYAFGDIDGNLNGVPADFDTGERGAGDNPTWMNIIATILKANGVDPAGFSGARPINAVLSA